MDAPHVLSIAHRSDELKPCPRKPSAKHSCPATQVRSCCNGRGPNILSRPMSMPGTSQLPAHQQSRYSPPCADSVTLPNEALPSLELTDRLPSLGKPAGQSEAPQVSKTINLSLGWKAPVKPSMLQVCPAMHVLSCSSSMAGPSRWSRPRSTAKCFASSHGLPVHQQSRNSPPNDVTVMFHSTEMDVVASDASSAMSGDVNGNRGMTTPKSSRHQHEAQYTLC